VLSEYRDQLVNERTAAANRVHTDLLWLRPGYQHQLPHLTNISHLHAALQLLDGEDSVRATVTRARLDRMLTLTEQLAELRIQIDALVKAGGSTLPEVYGVGPVVAATIIGHVVDVRRYPTRHHFAAANGTAPSLHRRGEPFDTG
jgi:transposase